jgi:hypothetical protein
MAPKRIDAADTVDNVTHLLHGLQADGWAIATATVRFQHRSPGKSGAKLPVRARVTIELTPTKP